MTLALGRRWKLWCFSRERIKRAIVFPPAPTRATPMPSIQTQDYYASPKP